MLSAVYLYIPSNSNSVYLPLRLYVSYQMDQWRLVAVSVKRKVQSPLTVELDTVANTVSVISPLQDSCKTAPSYR